jgi:hypothetical protein
MNNNLLQIKFKERLNKLASLDYDNLECWQIVEAFNKAQLEWVRRQVAGTNIRKQGDEASKIMIDDLQILVSEAVLPGSGYETYFETDKLPANYLYFKRMTAIAKDECCPSRPVVVYLAEVGDVDNLLYDAFRKPSFEWGETFCTMGNNRCRIYTDKTFNIEKTTLTYYRLPRPINFDGCVNISTGAVGTNVESEFKDDIVEIIIDEAVAILAGDIENFSQYQRNKSNAQNNS